MPVQNNLPLANSSNTLIEERHTYTFYQGPNHPFIKINLSDIESSYNSSLKKNYKFFFRECLMNTHGEFVVLVVIVRNHALIRLCPCNYQKASKKIHNLLKQKICKEFISSFRGLKISKCIFMTTFIGPLIDTLAIMIGKI